MLKIDIVKEIYGSNGKMSLDIDLNIEDGEFVALTGHSGSGKTTLLRVLAGLEEAKGKIEFNGRYWLNGKISIPPQKRDIGFVFQEYALFPNMSVEDNLLFVDKNRDLANRLLEITELNNLKKRKPNNLSGGQQQRVAFCRAMMNQPKLLLMDEPLSALDPKMRSKLQNTILTIHREFKTTTIMVTHDPSEIYHLADRVLVLEHGKIINSGVPRDILINSNQELIFDGTILDISDKKAVVSIGKQIIEIKINNNIDLAIGDIVTLTTDSFRIN